MTLTLHAKTGFGSNQDNVSKLLYLHLNFALETATLFRHSLKHKSDVQTSSSAVEIHRTTYGLPSTSANPSARRSNQPTEHTCVCHNTQIRTSNSWPRISNSQTSIFFNPTHLPTCLILPEPVMTTPAVPLIIPLWYITSLRFPLRLSAHLYPHHAAWTYLDTGIPIWSNLHSVLTMYRLPSLLKKILLPFSIMSCWNYIAIHCSSQHVHSIPPIFILSAYSVLSMTRSFDEQKTKLNYAQVLSVKVRI